MKYSDQKGVSLIITFFVMIILISVVLATSTFLYNEIDFVKNVSSSVVSFYAADSGIEKVLYYDRNILPGGGTTERGVCQMCAVSSPTCTTNEGGDASLNCLSCSVVHGTNPNGCNPNVCSDCTVSFTTSFDNGDSSSIKASYNVKATVYPNATPYDMDIGSSGLFNDVGRAIDVVTNTNP